MPIVAYPTYGEDAEFAERARLIDTDMLFRQRKVLNETIEGVYRRYFTESWDESTGRSMLYVLGILKRVTDEIERRQLERID